LKSKKRGVKIEKRSVVIKDGNVSRFINGIAYHLKGFYEGEIFL
jgi:hypothetical protein